jgi:hypothetical protein
MEDPQNGWFIMENPNIEWMKPRGIPILGTPISGYFLQLIVRG